MKKFVSLLLVACTCITAAGTCAGCGEKQHTFETEWSYDETYHWHACEDEDCLEVSEKAEHSWNEGTITVEATIDKEGVKTYTCDECGKTKTELVVYEPTQKEVWQNAFESSNYVNYTIRDERSDGGGFIIKSAMVGGDRVVHLSTFNVNNEEWETYCFWFETKEKKYIEYKYWNGTWHKYSVVESDKIIDFCNFALSYKLLCPDFGAEFEKFTFDNTENIYRFQGVEGSNEISTNSIGENWDTKYYFATVKIVDGKLNHVSVKMSGQHGRVDNIYFEKLGTTEIVLPSFDNALEE